MSLRQQAKILGIAPSYLSMLVNGKRPSNPGIKQRYDELVNSVVNTSSKQIAPPIGGRKKQLFSFGGSARESNPPHQSKDCCQRI